jgi:hypothetical protein
VLAADGLDDLDELFARFWPAQTRHAGRHVARATLGSNDVVFIKLQTKRPRLIPTIRDLRDGRFFRSQPENEWHGLQLLRAAGLHAAQPLALYRRGWRRFRAAVVIRAVPPENSLHDLLSDGTWTSLPPTDRRAIMRAGRAVVERIHHAGLAWAGVAAKHLYPERSPDGSWHHWLIDCEGVHRDPRGRQLARDRQKLRQSVQRSGADEEALGWLDAD